MDSDPQHRSGQSLFSLKQDAVLTRIAAAIEHGTRHPVNGLAIRHHSFDGAAAPPIRSTILPSTRPAALARWRTNLSSTAAGWRVSALAVVEGKGLTALGIGKDLKILWQTGDSRGDEVRFRADD